MGTIVETKQKATARMPGLDEGFHGATEIVGGYLAVAVEAMLTASEQMGTLRLDDDEKLANLATNMEIAARHIQKYLWAKQFSRIV